MLLLMGLDSEGVIEGLELDVGESGAEVLVRERTPQRAAGHIREASVFGHGGGGGGYGKCYSVTDGEVEVVFVLRQTGTFGDMRLRVGMGFWVRATDQWN